MSHPASIWQIPISCAAICRSVQTNGFTTSTLFGSDTVTGVAGLASGTNAGTYLDTLSAATGSGLANYTINYVNGSLAIFALPTVFTPLPSVYLLPQSGASPDQIRSHVTQYEKCLLAKCADIKILNDKFFQDVARPCAL